MHGNSSLIGIIINSFLEICAAIYVLLALIFTIPTWFITKKAGFSPWLSLLCLFPLSGLIWFYLLAILRWRVVPADRVAAPPEA